MAIAHLNVAIVGRSDGQSSVHAAAYAARERLTDERTGIVYDYGRKSADVVTSWVWLPKGAPEHLRDRAALWNGVEAAETRKNSQLARRFIVALPHELTPEQQQMLLKDFVREQFTRKGLAADVSIHKPHAFGDQRNDHAHILIPTRFIDKTGIAKKDRESNDREMLHVWRDQWEKTVNRHLERRGHDERIDMRSLEAQGIHRTPQIHLGQGAHALERKGIETDRGEELRGIANDNGLGRESANDNIQGAPSVGNKFNYAAGRDFAREVISPPVQRPVQQDWTAGKEFAREHIRPPQRTASNDNRPETIDRDAQAAASQDAIDSAGIAYAEEQRRQFLQSQAAERATFERRGEEMTARHAESWGEVMQRHHAEAAAILETAATGYQPGTMADAGQAASGGLSFLLGLFTSWAESITRSVTGNSKQQSKRQPGPDKTKQREMQHRAGQQQEAHSRELEAILQEQAREREAYERRRALMLFQQAGALQNFEQEVSQKSSMQQAFEQQNERVKGHQTHKAEKAERDGWREGRQHDGPELGS